MPKLELDHLNKSYGSLKALTDMTFDVHGGELFGFVGSNGAGKTTTMRIALGVLSPDSGEVRWDGKPVDLSVRQRIGYMPEERGLYPRMKVGEQLVYLAQLHGLTKAAATKAMEEWTETLGVDSRRGDDVEKLSLGNQQRVQLASALVHSPDILVLDEPFSGLDPVAVDVMSAVLRDQAKRGVPVIFSSHQLELVERLCDRVGIVSAGKLVASGTITELRTTERPQWRLVLPQINPSQVLHDPNSWLNQLPGTTVLSADETGAIVLEITDPSGSEQHILRQAVTHTHVAEFVQVRPSLTELFRDVVSEPATQEDAA